MVGLAQAGANTPAGGANRNSTFNNNPYNSPIRRANPNSRQGTTSSIPSNRISPQTNPRPPTLENGGIGNGAQSRQLPSGAPSSPPSRDLNR
ncbi:hypothetical protein QN382_14645 [Pseudomonas sp. 10B1]|nr:MULTISPECIES: hypothetical protein [unclassified Pseudomonas]MDY7561513.1 hypothetical protein [Pseudomonas sp. AB6]MEA9979184.1 hypothetical protein [Pseudomonas sp. RTS4]MEA9994953.1 hypothetical protein [Pseudomonas sp. AA4]MEB0088227.1 hypothetical protein [Pseudomonas sp. RTI1]MEB0127101.1 hypothetical protein [Pseudomonas sp. CCC1.2]